MKIKVIGFVITWLCFSSFVHMVYVLHTGFYPEKKAIHAQEIRVLYLITGNDAHVQLFRRQPKKPPEALCAAREDCDILSKVVLYEARGETVEGQRAVAFVVLNRVRDENFPNSVREVVLQKKQFSFVGNTHKQIEPTKKDIAKARKVAYNVLKGKVKNPVGKSLYFHSTKIKPYWAKGKPKKIIGNHVFVGEM